MIAPFQGKGVKMVKSSQFLNKVGVVAMASLVALIFVSVDLSKASTVQSDTDNNKKSVTESQNYDLEKLLEADKKEKEKMAEEKSKEEKEIKPKAKPDRLEAKLSLAYGNYDEYSSTNNYGLEVSCFGIELAYNTYIDEWQEEEVLKEFSAAILYKPAQFEEFSLRIGVKGFSYDRSTFLNSGLGGRGVKGYEKGTIWGAKIGFFGNTSITKRIGLFSEIGAILLIDKEFLPEIRGGLTLKIVSPITVEVGLRRLGLSSDDYFNFGGGGIKIELTFK